jgi:hypothetical protein
LTATIWWTLAAQAGDWSPGRSEALIQLPGAEDVSYDVYKGRERLMYSLTAEYPATEILDEIRSRLRTQGWKPLEDNYFMTGVPTSHVTGWEQCEETGTEQDVQVMVHAWSADWINAQGDVVLYGLKYSYPKDGQVDLSHLQIFAVFFPKRVAESLRHSPSGVLSD